MAYAHRVRYAYATYGTCALIHAHTRFRRSQTIATVCVRHFSSVWVCRPTARIKTRGWRRSDADCRFLLFCSNRGQRVNPRLSVTVALASLQLTPALHTPITQSEETGYVCSLSTMHNINAVRQLGVRSLR